MSQVSDYNIANASGASVRSDLNAVFDAIKTLNSGGSDPSNTEAFMPYVDTADSNNLKIRNAANDGFTTIGSINETNLGLLLKSGGTMTGNILGHDGSGASSPAYSFDGDTDTGMFRSGSNVIGFSTAGTQRVGISDSGLDMSNGLPIRFQDSSGAPFVALKSPSSVSSNVTFNLPGADGTSGQMLQTDGSGSLSFTTIQGVPVGSVFCIAHTSVPSGYVECNGASIPNGTGTVNGVTANFAALRALIGSSLPDLRGEFVRGFDNGKGTDSGRSMLSSQGDQNKSHNHSASTSISDPGHFHQAFRSGNHGERRTESNLNSSNFAGSGSGAGNLNEAYNITATNAVANVGKTSSVNTGVNASTNVGNDGSSESRPRNVAMMYIIKF
nr:phage tail fiber protein [uncultured Mediterranean phage uvMED]BAR21512.1 phage tail fiber protein [uncultured Mediterranean phage uvMED]BAR21524.1 phage tail fiber protein [uncultured Mediterranean phage uvMED]BAR38657.1 phage tail fiber protein [uncultured Mediterranean phage uvMED]